MIWNIREMEENHSNMELYWIKPELSGSMKINKFCIVWNLVEYIWINAYLVIIFGTFDGGNRFLNSETFVIFTPVIGENSLEKLNSI